MTARINPISSAIRADVKGIMTSRAVRSPRLEYILQFIEKKTLK